MSEPIESLLRWISSNSPRNIAVLTGAGISAESGVPTFRGPGGLWENHRPEDLATPEAFGRDPKLVWRWYEWRRGTVRGAEPNAAHFALATLSAKLPELGGSFTLITQNVDELHRRAGNESLIELHGSMFRVRCTSEQSISARNEPFDELPPRCSCGALLRPDVVWFGEPLPQRALAEAAEAVARADMLLVIGTSGIVYPAAGLVGVIAHGITVEINPQTTPITDSCDFAIASSAVEAVPRIADEILGSAR